MIEACFSTADVAAPDRFDYWQERHSGATRVPLETTSRHTANFLATQRTLRLDELTVWQASFQRLVIRRTHRLIRQSDPETYHISLVQQGTGGAAWSDRQLAYRRHDLAVQSSSRPCTAWADDGQDVFEMIGVEVPSANLPLPKDEADAVVGIPMSGRDGIGALLAGVLTRLVRDAATYREADGARLGMVVADLVAALVAWTLDLDRALPPESRRHALLLRVRAFITTHLSDPDLGPASIAAAHHISVSYLHRLFQADGTSVMAWIRRQRLDRTARDLADPVHRSTPVHEIAARRGFLRPPVFTRAFRAEYGMSPREYRLRNAVCA